MNTAYRILARVTLEHDYYTDNRCSDFDIVPTAATAAILNGLGLRCKMVDNVLLILIKINDAGKPNIDIPAGLKLSFYLELMNTSFINYTNVTYQPQDTILYFSNLDKTKVNGLFYINKQVAAYSNSGNYAIGDMVHDGANNVFEALKPVINGSHNTSDANWWYKRNDLQYVNNQDQIVITDGRLTAQILPVKTFDTAFFSINPDTFVYDVPVGEVRHIEFPENQAIISVDMQGMNPGKYRVVINGQERYVFLDKEASYRRVFGVIELYNSFPSGSDVGWLDNAGKPKSIEYLVRFANRLVLWKYIVHNEELTGIEDTDVPGAFTAALLPQQFISVNPLPLKQKAVKTLQLMKNATVITTRLPNPNPLFINTYTDNNNNKYYCAEMYLNQ